MTGVAKPQLKMNWPLEKLSQPPSVPLPAGYELRQCAASDQQSFVALMAACGWEFDQERLSYCHAHLLPGGWFAVAPTGSSEIVASAMSLHNYSGCSMYSGTLGWVGCLPEHRGHQLGTVVAAAATSRLIDGQYTDVELYTEHFRLPAVEIYFRLGYLPYIYNEAVEQTWCEVCRQLSRPFEPHLWPHGDNAFPKT